MQTLLLAQVQWGQVGIVIGIFAAIAVLLTVCILLVAKFCKTNADVYAGVTQVEGVSMALGTVANDSNGAF